MVYRNLCATYLLLCEECQVTLRRVFETYISGSFVAAAFLLFIRETLAYIQRRDCVLCSEGRLCPVFKGERDCVLCSEERLCPVFRGETVSCVQRRDCVLCSEERPCPVLRGETVSCVQRRDCVLCSEERLCLVFRGVIGIW